jgi:hypothetical protein
MNPVLTVGDGSSFLRSGAAPSTGAAHLQVKPAGNGNGGSGSSSSNGQTDRAASGSVAEEDDGDVGMEDEEGGGGPDGQKRAGKRKLEP